MKTETLKRLYAASCRTDPFHAMPALTALGRSAQAPGRSRNLDGEKFLFRPDACWQLALRFAGNRSRCSLLDQPECRWIKAAVEVLHSEGRSCLAETPKVVIAARGLHTGGSGDALSAALLARDATIDAVASGLGLDPGLVECFENLFFRVLWLQREPVRRELAMQWAMESGSKNPWFGETSSGWETMWRIALTSDLDQILAVWRDGLAASHAAGADGVADELLKAWGKTWLRANLAADCKVPALVRMALELHSKSDGKPTQYSHTSGGAFGTISRERLLKRSQDLQEQVANVARGKSMFHVP